jgi:hypothetical protein
MADRMKNPIYTAARVKRRPEILGLWDGSAWCDVPCLIIACFRPEGSGHRPFTIEKGNLWRANFYKCGDDTSHPHWAAWSPVDELNFHLPRCFGRLGFAAQRTRSREIEVFTGDNSKFPKPLTYLLYLITF